MPKPILIIDLEATCWDKSIQQPTQTYRNEIIEIGFALIVDNKIIYNDTYFVKPILNSELSDFCKSLTSISQDQVDSAQSLKYVISQFSNKILELANCSLKEVTFVSWGNYDRKQFEIDCNLHEIPYPFGEHINLKKQFLSRFKTKKAGMPLALEMLNLELTGIHHRGKDDAYNIAKIYLALNAL